RRRRLRAGVRARGVARAVRLAGATGGRRWPGAFLAPGRARRRAPARRGRFRRSGAMSGGRLAAWFAGAFAIGLLLFAPMQLVLPRLALPPALSATAIEGNLWRGHLRQAHWRGAALGELPLGLSPLPLLVGRQRLWLTGPHAALTVNAGRIRGVDGANGVLPLPAPAGLALRASLEEATLLFDDGGCREAGGRVRVELALPGDTLPPLILAGTPACEGREGTLALAPEQAAG